jgi:uncharacterized nucleotidyltransferase DUF6036
MPDDQLIKVQLPKPWPEFLKEVDGKLADSVHLHCIGGFIATAVYGVPRYTGDLDYAGIVPKQAAQGLQDLAGPESGLARKYKVCIHSAGIVDLPEDYESRLRQLDLELPHLHIWIVDPYDLVLAKLTRNSPKDREDVKFLSRHLKLDFQILDQRWKNEMKPWVPNADRHENTINSVWKDYFGSQ